MSKIKLIGLGIVVLFVGIGIGRLSSSVSLGGYIHNIQESFDAGIAVNGTEVISSTRQGSLATSTFTGTMHANNVVTRGVITNISAASTTSLTSAQVCNSNIITISPNYVMSSTTLPSSASMNADCLTANGDSKTVLIRNISTTASSTTLISVSSTTATTFLVPTSTSAIAGSNNILRGGDSAWLTTIRKTATETIDILINLVDGD